MVHSIDINGISGQASALLGSSEARPPVAISAAPDQSSKAIAAAIHALQSWIEERDYAGHEPYDILNSPLLRAQVFRLRPVSWSLIQAGKCGGTALRRILRIPASKNPKALGLMLAGYSDRLLGGESCSRQIGYLKSQLRSLRSPGEAWLCWGYDWDFVALRGTLLPAFRPNAVATVFCGQALLDLSDHPKPANGYQNRPTRIASGTLTPAGACSLRGHGQCLERREETASFSFGTARLAAAEDPAGYAHPS